MTSLTPPPLVSEARNCTTRPATSAAKLKSFSLVYVLCTRLAYVNAARSGIYERDPPYKSARSRKSRLRGCVIGWRVTRISKCDSRRSNEKFGRGSAAIVANPDPRKYAHYSVCVCVSRSFFDRRIKSSAHNKAARTHQSRSDSSKT